ncbi:MAG: hypothetical protein A2X42_05245 [Candidatus Margulisbacteria bacterium GWF2_38_17]|nr:MAG: hypothetical protein A2X43_00430 [Candidatus Margulisbacteria bacterium GWD2_39_127]OGI04320.1 MAG: hypothetical protein A2X42_05245 [Candidatus Margulisbacteria bacterium GWF2_38_17]OGI11908.1 MAG: hypothetical protein A2X41_11005 [Candidatus Margulisbacteria bacterium GWE2_39_32]
MDFMQNALIAGIILSFLTGIISIFIILRKLAFIGVGISHAAFGGVALGIYLGINPTLSGIVFSIFVALAIGYVSKRGRIKEDTSIGIFFTSAMALGVILIGISRQYNVDVFGYLFGNILAISRSDIYIIAILGIIVTAILITLSKELLFISFDEEVAKVDGIPVNFLNYLFLVILAITVVIGTKIIGLTLISALLIIPGATAIFLSAKFFKMVTIAITSSIISTICGLMISYYLNVASGATIVLTATAIFFLAFFYASITEKIQSH